MTIEFEEGLNTQGTVELLQEDFDFVEMTRDRYAQLAGYFDKIPSEKFEDGYNFLVFLQEPELEVEAITNSEVHAFVHLSRIQDPKVAIHTAFMNKLKKVLPRCPKCNKALVLRGIYTPKGKNNIQGWRSQYFCNGEDCTYEKFMVQTEVVILKKLFRKYSRRK